MASTSVIARVAFAKPLEAGHVDVATRFRFNFLSSEWFILALLVGVVLSSGAVIGWAKQFSVKTR